jgi:hypothetical protein
MTLGNTFSLPGDTVSGVWAGRLSDAEIPYDFLDRYMGGFPLVVHSTVSYNGMSLSTCLTLLDSGANGFLFVSVTFAKRLLKLLRLRRLTNFKPKVIGGFDGKLSQIIDIALVAHFKIQGRTVGEIPLMVVDMPVDIIVGKHYMKYYNVGVDVPRNRLLFFDETWVPDYTSHDIAMDEADQPKPSKPVWDEWAQATEEAMEKEDQERVAFRNRPPKEEPRTVASMATQQAVTQRIQILQRQIEDAKSARDTPQSPRSVQFKFNIPDQGREQDEVTDEEWDKMTRQLEGLPPQKSHAESETEEELDADWEIIEKRKGRGREKPATGSRLARDCVGWFWQKDTTPDPFDIMMVNAETFLLNARIEGDPIIGSISLYEIDKEVEARKSDPLNRDTEDLREQAREKVPERYHDLLDVFSKASSDDLPPHRPYDHKIELEPDAKPEDLGFSPLYKMSLEELKVCREHIEENLKKGFIEPSSAPWAAPVLFVRKANGGLRFCVDYRKLNAISKKDRYPLPLIEETLARIASAKIFTKIDVRQAFHRIRMDPESVEKTAFRTRYGAYVYKVLPFGLSNGPSTFQRYINDKLFDYLDDFCCAYIDDILIYSDNELEHEIHVRKVLERLREAGLQADLKKCEFHVTHTKFLGFIIGTDGVEVDPDKIAVVRDWEPPRNLKALQGFLGFCNFYRKFVRDYGKIARPLHDLTRKNRDYSWGADQQEAFEILKDKLIHAPVLAHFHYDLETRVETDSSDTVVGGVLSQKQPDENWRPVAFFSTAMLPAEQNYPIHDKELLAVVQALKHWRAELIGLQREYPFLVITDHRALEYFSTKRLLNPRQAGWQEFFADFNFEITYRPGTENLAADAMSRKNEIVTTQKERLVLYRTTAIFRRDPDRDTPEATISILSDPTAEPPKLSGAELSALLLEANRTDESLKGYRRLAREGKKPFGMLDDKYVLHDDRLIVPETDNLRTFIIRDIHDGLPTAHPGRNKTRKMVAVQYWWPGITSDVNQYTANCRVCRSSKVPRDKTPGLLQPLPIPLRSWQHIAADFKSMPKDKHGYDNILVMVDRLSKITWSVPCHRDVTARQTAWLYYKGPYRILGLPESWTSDRGPQFTAEFTDELSRILGVKLKLASAGHKQTAGQAEIINQYLDQRLRPYLNHYQDNWSEALPAMDAVQASTPHDST